MNVMRPKCTCWESGLERMISECLKPNSIVLEIGSFAGEGTDIFLRSGKVNGMYCIDAWQNGLDPTDITTPNFDLGEIEKVFDSVVEKYKPMPMVIKVKANSLECYNKFPAKFFDMVYHDACHTFEHLEEELYLYRYVVKDKGIVAGHDYASAYPGVTRAVNERYGSPDRVYEDLSWVKFI